MSDGFEITKEEKNDALKFHVKGRVDSLNANALQFRLDEALRDGNIIIVLNMSQVGYISSTGIRVLLKTYKEAGELGGSFKIEYPSDNVKNVLGMTALDEMLLS